MPKNLQVIDTKSKNSLVIDTKSKNSLINGETKAYIESWTILQGQPIPWGLNWLITYPATMTFNATRM